MTWYKSKRVWVIAAAIILILLVVGLVVWVRYDNSKTKVDSFGTPTSAIQDVVNTSVNDNSAGNYAAALTLLNAHLAGTNGADKQQLYLAIGATDMNKQDYAAAITAYQQADQIKSGFGTSEAVGDAASAAGDNQLAISQYKKCITLAQNGAPGGGSSEIASLKSEITTLGGTP